MKKKKIAERKAKDTDNQPAEELTEQNNIDDKVTMTDTNMKFIAIDFETANSARQSVCAIGLAFVEDFKVVKTVYRLIRPTPDFYEDLNISIHGITPDMTENEPTFANLWYELKPYFENNKMVAHNASFDFSALECVLDHYQIRYPSLDYYCTYLLSKKIFPGLKNYKLPTVCEHLGIHGLVHHEAESDAVACANIMIEICKACNVTSLDELEQLLDFSKGEIRPNSTRPFSCHIQESFEERQFFYDFYELKESDKEHPFYEKRVVFTGELSKFSRNDAKMIVDIIGGASEPSALSGKSNYLVVGTYDTFIYGENYKSSKLRKAEELIAKGKDIKILSEIDFLKLVHPRYSSVEVSTKRIKNNSTFFLERNNYNALSKKSVCFFGDMKIDKQTATQLVGHCSGYGDDYNCDEIAQSDYIVISKKLMADLENGIKSNSILEFEKLKKEAKDQGDMKIVRFISEHALLKYLKKREKFQKGEIKMGVHEWE